MSKAQSIHNITDTSVAVSSLSDSFEKEGDLSWSSLDRIAGAISFCGRTSEKLQLLRTYERVVQSHESEIVTVHGLSGCGKTALVDTLRKPVCESNGYFCAGKYFQEHQIQDPYSALMAAFSDLCDLVVQSEDFNEARQEQIRQDLGSDGKLLTNSITSLSHFLQDAASPSDECLRNDTAFTKFKVACKTFLRAMSSPQHPIVLFLDDIQWMDTGSKELLSLLLRDASLSNVMIILAYREENASCVQDVVTQEAGAPVLTSVQLSNFDSSTVAQMVSSIIGSPMSNQQTGDLSELVFRRTGGNPFHVQHFVESMQKEGLLIFDASTKAYVFNVDQIQREMMVSETLADLLLRKIRRLPRHVQETLKVASLLGYVFERELLMEVVAHVLSEESSSSMDVAGSARSATSSLDEALREGYIEATKNNGSLQFCHDKLQASFLSMYEESEKARLHLLIGETILATQSGPESLYHATQHLNQCPDYNRHITNRLKLVRMNFQAAQYLKEKSAFADACSCLRKGLQLLDVDPKSKWTTHFDLAFAMTEFLARLELIVGDLGRCRATVGEALSRAKSVEMKIKSLLIDIECHMAGNEMNATVTTANRALEVLGFGMPFKVVKRHVVLKLLKVRRRIGRKSDEDILALPEMTDNIMRTAVRILLYLCTYCYLKDEPLYGAYTALLAIELTLKGGLSPYSSSAMTIYGVAELSLGNHLRAYRFGKLSMKLLEQIECRDAECPTRAICITILLHWKESISDLLEPLLRNMECGFATGDVVYGVYSVATTFGSHLIHGVPLPQLEEFMWSSYRRVCDLSQDSMIHWTQPVFQFVLNMQRHGPNWRELTVLSGDVMIESEYLTFAVDAGHRILMVLSWSFKAMLCFHFGFYSEAVKIYQDIAAIGDAFRMAYGAKQYLFFESLTHYAMFAQTKRRKHLRKGRSLLRTLRRFRDNVGCIDASYYVDLLEAEDLSTRRSSSVEVIVAAYDHAILVMARQKRDHLEALANERAGFALASKLPIDSDTYFERAMCLYKYQWGAIGKYEWLKWKVTMDRLRSCRRPSSFKETRLIGDVIRVTHHSESAPSQSILDING